MFREKVLHLLFCFNFIFSCADHNAFSQIPWSRTYGGNDIDDAKSVQQTPDSCFVLAGRTSSFGAGGEDFLVVKTNLSGDVIWSKTYGGSEDDWGRSIEQTIDGGFIIAGGTNSYGAGGSDLWLLKTNNFGDSLWARSYGGSEDDWAYSSIHQTPDNGYIITGSILYLSGPVPGIDILLKRIQLATLLQ